MSDIKINNTDELEAMRMQMQELKSTLDHHELVNEKLLRRIIANNSGWINKYTNFQLYFLLPFIAISMLGLKLSTNMSWLFYWFSVIMVAVCVIFDFYINRISRKEYTTMALVELASALERRRRYRRLQLLISLPIVIPWMIWYGYEISDGAPYMWIAIIIGGLVGGSIGLCITRRMQKTDAAAIGDIRQFMEEK